MVKKIHYQNPHSKSPRYCCGMGGAETATIAKSFAGVTCDRCLEIIAQNKLTQEKKPSRGRPREGDICKLRATFTIEPRLMEKLQQEPNKSGLINRLLRRHYHCL